MGDIADAMLDGTLCSVCGEYLDDDKNDFPTMCAGCAMDDSDDEEDAEDDE